MDNRTKKHWKRAVKARLRTCALPTPDRTDRAPDGDGAAILDAAIAQALARTANLPDGRLRLLLVELVYIRHTHTLQGAAQKCYISYRTARRWNQSFLRLAVQLCEAGQTMATEGEQHGSASHLHG